MRAGAGGGAVPGRGASAARRGGAAGAAAAAALGQRRGAGARLCAGNELGVRGPRMIGYCLIAFYFDIIEDVNFVSYADQESVCCA